jgi:predicted ATP-grasp superfamily ATP-dependent carboligase
MRFFVYEYLSAGVNPALPDSLRIEGSAMLRAVAEDLAWLPCAEVRTLLPPSFSAQPDCQAERFSACDEEHGFRRLARWADFSLIIAPEFDEILRTRCRWVEEENGCLLGPSSQAVAVAADKLDLVRQLLKKNIRTPECVKFTEGSSLAYPHICKPRFGAGSQAVYLLRSDVDRAYCVETLRAEGWQGELLFQRFVPGQAASVAFLIGPRRCVPLAPAAQRLSADGRFRYLGGSLPLPSELAARAIRVARPAIEAIAGLLGYVGVDVVLGAAEDGSCDWVIEVNPRLTTSYIGLRQLANANLAEAMLRLVQGQDIADIAWDERRIGFSCDGSLLN